MPSESSPTRDTQNMLKRFSISLEENLLEIFDNHIRARSYTNRSEAIRDLIRKAFVKKEWQADKEVMGVISLVYDHHQHKLQDKVTEVQHGYHHHIVSTTHVHMDHDNCLEVIIVRGKAKEIQELSDKLVALRGIRDGHLAMSSTGRFLH
ncbi:nickel-responsive transcriptional regulator NikR [Desulfoprunum sp.]|uniref:nickel-responsive transcriptional regulator NikR n=1 Tax=Desulfoprunum sp. TaxID=2020866 RepID=UPI003C787D35